MRKCIIIGVAVLCYASLASAAVIYQEGFENGLGAYTLTGTPTTSTDQVHEGSYSMVTTSSGQRARTAMTATTDAFTYTYWLYDNGGARAFAQLTAYSGGWGTGLQQLFAIGKYNTSDLNLGSGAEAYQNTKYQARITNGVSGATAGSWFNLNADGVPSRSVGWHKFSIIVADDYSKASFYVDDILGRELNLTASGKPAGGFNWVSYGLGAGTTTETFYYDQASLITIPEPASLALVALGGLLLRRRRTA